MTTYIGDLRPQNVSKTTTWIHGNDSAPHQKLVSKTVERLHYYNADKILQRGSTTTTRLHDHNLSSTKMRVQDQNEDPIPTRAYRTTTGLHDFNLAESRKWPRGNNEAAN